MHIVLSGMFWNQPTVGSGQYLHGLLEALLRVGPQHRYSVLVPAYWNAKRTIAEGSGTLRLPELAETSTASVDEPFYDLRFTLYALKTPFDTRSPNMAKLWFEQVSVPLAAVRLGADVLHVPYFAPPRFSPTPLVTTVLDIIPLRLPEYRGRAAVRAYMRLVAHAARRTPQLVAISEHSCGEIAATLDVPPERITVTPLAAGHQYRPSAENAAAIVAARYGVCEPFVYYVGGLDARKNVPMLVRAFARMRRSGGPPALLAIAGRALGADARLFPDLDAVIAEENAAAFVRRLDVPPDDAPLLYRAATAFAFPSRYEGFGLPPLEAMACGAPVIAAAASSLPEVLGDAALLVHPDDVAGWANALWRVLADETLRAEMRHRGFARAAEFGYDRTARETLAVYARAQAATVSG